MNFVNKKKEFIDDVILLYDNYNGIILYNHKINKKNNSTNYEIKKIKEININNKNKMICFEMLS